MLKGIVIPAYPLKSMPILTMPLGGKLDAKAGIQANVMSALIQHSETLSELDSRLRGNDGL